MLLKKTLLILLYLFAGLGLLFIGMYFAVRFGFTKTAGIVIDKQSDFFKQTSAGKIRETQPDWARGPEWQTFKDAVLKDSGIVNHVSQITGVPARLIVSQLVVEQLRLFYTNREVFKKFFEPLKILGSQSQFSWGINGLKRETAIEIEKNLISPDSQYYLGKEYEHLLDFKTADPEEERFERIIDEHDHYWSYLYTALYLKQIMAQWNKAGFDIHDKPGILSTLYNIGFTHSIPNGNPKSGGASIMIGNVQYGFGSLAEEFYYSAELQDLFPILN